MTRIQVYELFRHFKEDRQSVDNYEICRRLGNRRKEKHITYITYLRREITTLELSENVHINHGSFDFIITDD